MTSWLVIFRVGWQLTGHFQSYYLVDRSFSEVLFSELFFLNIYRTNSKTSKENQLSVLNL